MLIDLWNSMDGKTVFGLTCLAVLLYWLKRVEYPKDADVLGEPRMDCIDKGPLQHWEAGEGHVRTP